MFLRRNRRIVDGEVCDYWTLVNTVRTARGPRQEIVATLGKEPGLESRSRPGWDQVADLLDGRAPALDFVMTAFTRNLLQFSSLCSREVAKLGGTK